MHVPFKTWKWTHFVQLWQLIQLKQVIHIKISVPDNTGSCAWSLKAKNVRKIKNLLILMVLLFLLWLPLNLVIRNSNLKIHEWNFLNYLSCCYFSLCIPQVKLYFLAKSKPNCIISLGCFATSKPDITHEG